MNVFQTFNSPGFVRLALALLHFLWQGTVIGLLTLAAAHVLGKKSSRVRYGMYVVALLAMVATLGGTYLLVDAPMLGERETSYVTAPARSEPQTAAVKPALEPSTQVAQPETMRGANQVPALGLVEQPIGVKSSLGLECRKYAPYVAAIYLFGVIVMTARLLTGLAGGQRLSRRSEPIGDSAILAALARQARSLGMTFTPAIAYCHRVTVPTVIGVLRPMILLPFSVTSGMTTEQIEMLLAHELAHICRHDPLVNVIQRIIEAVLFFHPMVWVISLAIRRERENCCDDRVLATGGTALGYAKSLVVMAEIGKLSDSSRRLASASLGAADRPSQLRLRILRLLGRADHEQLRLRRTWVAGVILAGLMGIAISPLLRSESGPDVKEQEIIAQDWKAVFPGGIEVELIGTANHPSRGRQWRRPDGTNLDAPPCDETGGKVSTNEHERAYEFVARLKNLPKEPIGIRMETQPIGIARVGPSGMEKNGKWLSEFQWIATVLPENLKRCAVRVGIASTQWERIVEAVRCKSGPWGSSSFGHAEGGIAFSEPIEREGRTVITVSHEMLDRNVRLIYIDKKNGIHTAVKTSSSGGTAFQQISAEFDIPLSEVETFQLQSRPFQWTIFPNVILPPPEQEDQESEAAEPAKTAVNLMDIETPEVDAVLDLAGGVMLSAEGMEKDRQYFNSLGKGDLCYDYAGNQGCLMCLRGAKMAVRTDDGISPVPPDVERDYFKGYVVGSRPVQYQLTTAEGRKYEIKFLSADAKSAEIEYWATPVDPSRNESQANLSEESPARPLLQFRLAAGENESDGSEAMPFRGKDSDGSKTIRLMREVLMDESDVSHAEVAEMNGQLAVSLKFTQEGKEEFARITGNNVDRRLAIVFDGEVIMAPVIRERIPRGTAQISGDFSQSEAQAIADALNDGKNSLETPPEPRPSSDVEAVKESVLDDRRRIAADVFRALVDGASSEAGVLLTPLFKWEDIPILLELAESKRVLKDPPANLDSSYHQDEGIEGMVALWGIEGLRRAQEELTDLSQVAGDHAPFKPLEMIAPSRAPLNAICTKKDMQMDLAGISQEIHQEALSAYRKWWEEFGSRDSREAAVFDPLDLTDLEWYGNPEQDELKFYSKPSEDGASADSIRKDRQGRVARIIYYELKDPAFSGKPLKKDTLKVQKVVLPYYDKDGRRIRTQEIRASLEENPRSSSTKREMILNELNLESAPVETRPENLPDLWEARPPGSGSYNVRSEVLAVYKGLDGTVYYIPEKDVFYVQHDLMGSSTLHYYGPFKSDSPVGLALKDLRTESAATPSPDTEAILEAAYVPDLRALKLLLDKNPGLIKPNARGDSPLHRAIRAQNEEMVKYLLERDPDLTSHDPADRTPLHWAAAIGREDLVEMLLSAGADVNAWSERRGTPLHEAVPFDRDPNAAPRACVEILLAHGADIDRVDKKGRTPRDIAAEMWKSGIVELLNRAEKEPRTAFRSTAPEPVCRIELVSKDGNKYRWKLTPEWPVRVITIWYTFEGDKCVEHGGGGSKNAWEDPVELAVETYFEDGFLRLKRSSAWGVRGSMQTAEATSQTSVPSGMTLESTWLSEPAVSVDRFLPLWTGRFVKDGEVVKTVVYAVRVVNRNDPDFDKKTIPADDSVEEQKSQRPEGADSPSIKIGGDLKMEIETGQ